MINHTLRVKKYINKQRRTVDLVKEICKQLLYSIAVI